MKQKTSIAEKKNGIMRRIENDKEQLNADRIYVEECEEKFSQLGKNVGRGGETCLV